MPGAGAKIGPNADPAAGPGAGGCRGPDTTAHLLAMAGVFELPDPDAGLMDEAPAARLHQALRGDARGGAHARAGGGLAHGDYILAHRIPRRATASAADARAALGADPRARGGKTRLDLLRLGRVPLVSTWPVVFEIAGQPGGARRALRNAALPLARGGVRAAVLRTLRTRLALRRNPLLRAGRPGLPVRDDPELTRRDPPFIFPKNTQNCRRQAVAGGSMPPATAPPQGR
jgi:divinyl protochlorophyllide a 8-vinyl-reductase